jgi:hypothetical protein
MAFINLEAAQSFRLTLTKKQKMVATMKITEYGVSSRGRIVLVSTINFLLLFMMFIVPFYQVQADEYEAFKNSFGKQKSAVQTLKKGKKVQNDRILRGIKKLDRKTSKVVTGKTHAAKLLRESGNRAKQKRSTLKFKALMKKRAQPKNTRKARFKLPKKTAPARGQGKVRFKFPAKKLSSKKAGYNRFKKSFTKNPGAKTAIRKGNIARANKSRNALKPRQAAKMVKNSAKARKIASVGKTLVKGSAVTAGVMYGAKILNCGDSGGKLGEKAKKAAGNLKLSRLGKCTKKVVSKDIRATKKNIKKVANFVGGIFSKAKKRK